MGNLVMVYGFSSEIKFYEFAGNAYVPKFTVSTTESDIRHLSIYDEGKKFMFGGSSQNISSYTLSDGSYQLAEQLQTGADILKLFVDPRQLYFSLVIWATSTV